MKLYNSFGFPTSFKNNFLIGILNNEINFMLIFETLNKISAIYRCDLWKINHLIKNKCVWFVNYKCSHIFSCKIMEGSFPSFINIFTFDFNVILGSESIKNLFVFQYLLNFYFFLETLFSSNFFSAFPPFPVFSIF